MADFSVQNDSGTVADANAYVEVSFFKSYHAARGNSYSGGTGDIQKAIVKATDYLDSRWNFVGARLSRDQTTEWPRRDAMDEQGYHITGVPDDVQEACAEYALVALSGDLETAPDRDSSGRVVASKAEKVGPIAQEVRYVSGAPYSPPEYPTADRKLAGLVESPGWADRG